MSENKRTVFKGKTQVFLTQSFQRKEKKNKG